MANYTVKQGDTLSDIAKKYGTTYQEIAKANGISDPNKIYAGQTLNIGDVSTSENQDTPSVNTETKAPSYEYKPYQPSDTVAQAEALLQQQLSQKPGEYTSPWQSQLNDIIQQIQNREKFSYDMNADALYQQYKDQYTTQGKLAMMDAMGRAQAMSGGYGNSYAQSVGQQAYQGYLQGLNDKIPELYQLALNQYNAEGDDMYNRASLLAGMEEQDYGRYRDTVSDYYTELDRLTEDSRYKGEQEYNKWADDQSFGYQQYRDQVADQQWQAQFDEAKRQYDEQMALSKSSSSASNNSSKGDYEYEGAKYTANPGWDKAKIKAFQEAHDLDVDGIWGPQTAAAYDKDPNWSPDGDKDPTYDDVVADINQLVAYASDPNSKTTMEGLWSNISGLLKDAQKEGYITKSEYNKLWSLYGPIGNAYN